jgi:hypothetical protein
MRRFLNARIVRTLVIAGGLAAMIGGVGATPARADWDGDHWRERGWREHERRDHEWRERERREREWREWRRHEWLERQRYYDGARRYYYPPAVYAAPSLSLGFDFR